MTVHNPISYDHFEKIYIHEYTFTYWKKVFSSFLIKIHISEWELDRYFQSSRKDINFLRHSKNWKVSRYFVHNKFPVYISPPNSGEVKIRAMRHADRDIWLYRGCQLSFPPVITGFRLPIPLIDSSPPPSSIF